ncbi:hypothetical protein [Azospirillum sp.]|uniref:MORN repeat-containing protein n=1 Tax=Azospirillum sp. TaxID=34012 RepID=UPI002D24910D|nr:hypothetical protein [Azospirillum sp.]HYD68159.1 hypothetical protein [Azospirillum sp.]
MRPAFLALAAFAAALPCAAAAQDDGHPEVVLTDRATGCAVRDRYPFPGKEVHWRGVCRHGFADGRGVLAWGEYGAEEGRVEGTFVQGSLEGEGRATWADGRRYTGAFRRGLAEGWGTFVWPDGQRYEGEWRADARTGTGTLFFPNGSRYVGKFERNRPTDGEFIAPDGRRYVAAVDSEGSIGPGAPVGGSRQNGSVQSAERPAPPPETLDEWLRQKPP